MYRIDKFSNVSFHVNVLFYLVYFLMEFDTCDTVIQRLDLTRIINFLPNGYLIFRYIVMTEGMDNAA